MNKLSSYFEPHTRTNGETFVSLSDAAPEWLRDACREAHQGDLPGDWCYEECRATCEAIDAGLLNAGDGAHEYADGRVDVYTKDLLGWAHEHCLSSLYSEAESRAEDIGEGGTVVEQLTRVQYCAIELIAETILAAYEKEI